MEEQRREMIEKIERFYKLDSPSVLSAMLQVPRHKFVDIKYHDVAYDDNPVSIGFGQTMSQPYTVAFMTHLIVSAKDKVQSAEGKDYKNWRVLEIGTGSGYQAAILSKLFKEVYTIEIIPELAKRASKLLKKLGYENIYVREGSGEWGWKEKAPFDAIIITAGVEKVPNELFEQLNVGGALVVPVGKGMDKVMTRFTKLINKTTEKLRNLKTEKFGIFHFVPFVEEGN